MSHEAARADISRAIEHARRALGLYSLPHVLLANREAMLARERLAAGLVMLEEAEMWLQRAEAIAGSRPEPMPAMPEAEYREGRDAAVAQARDIWAPMPGLAPDASEPREMMSEAFDAIHEQGRAEYNRLWRDRPPDPEPSSRERMG